MISLFLGHGPIPDVILGILAALATLPGLWVFCYRPAELDPVDEAVHRLRQALVRRRILEHRRGTRLVASGHDADPGAGTIAPIEPPARETAPARRDRPAPECLEGLITSPHRGGYS